MKVLGKILGVIVLLAIVALVVVRVVGVNPKDRRPGLWLTGDAVTTPVSDWSFTDKYPTIFLETMPPYMIAHSVTIACVSYNGQFYLHSGFPKGMPFPGGKAWTSAIDKNPHVRVKIGTQLYSGTAVVVTDPAQIAALNEAYAKKTPGPPPAAGSITYYYHFVPDAGGAKSWGSSTRGREKSNS